MQINPFGFPLGAGTQSASAFAGTGLGFVDALGAMAQGGLDQPMAIGAPALAQPAAPTAQPEAQIASTGTLPGFQQPTSLSQLMATAAKLPAAEPAAPATGAEIPVMPVNAAVTLADAPAVAAPDAAAPKAQIEAEAPAQAQPAPAGSGPQPQVTTLPADGQPQPDATLAAETPVVAKPVETAPTPRKTPRAATALTEADPAQPADAGALVPAELLAAGTPLQPVVRQPLQPNPREATQATNGATAPIARKAAAANLSASDAIQPAAAPSTADFANAVAARGESAGGEANADAQGQPDARPAGMVRSDAAAPAFQPTQATSAASPTAPSSAPVAEPVIEARTGHLGQSLGVEIARKVELGEETLRIRLNPIELGRIEVTLAFDDKGSLQATVRTESAQAMDLLRQDAPDLARTLDQAGVRTDAQSFRFEQRGGDGGGQQAQQQHSQNRGQFASSDDDADVAEPIYRPVRSDGQVDLLA